MIDEAHNVHPDNIDALSDLSNFQTADDKLITIVLLAQDNFPNKLSRKDAFRSRIAVVSNLDPLTPDDTNAMIAHRLKTAGGPNSAITSPSLPWWRSIMSPGESRVTCACSVTRPC